MRPDDKRELRKQLIEVLDAYTQNPDSDKIQTTIREIHGTHKGQISLLDEDLAKAIQLLEELGYSNVSLQDVREELTATKEELQLASR